MELKGKIIEIFEAKEVSNKFRKREFVIECIENPKYPEKIKVEMIQDNCDHLDRYNKGDEVNASINLKGREWIDGNGEVKYFNTIQVWRMNKVDNNEINQSINNDLPFN